MTEPTVDTADDQTPADPAPAGEDTDTGDTARTTNSEAAKWRRKFRAAEVEVTVLRAREEERDRRDIERIAAELLADGADIWREPIDIADLCDELGLPDAERVHARAEQLIAAHRHWAKRGPATPAASAVTGDGTPPARQPASWTDAIRSHVTR